MGSSTKAKNSDRRSFLRRMLGLTAMAGLVGVLSNRILGDEVLPTVQATNSNL